MKRRTKQLQGLINAANEYLERNEVKDQKNELFRFLCWYLLRIDCYGGFNFCKHKELDDGSKILTLAGTDDPEKFDCLYIY